MVQLQGVRWDRRMRERQDVWGCFCKIDAYGVGITREYHKALQAYGDSGKNAGRDCAAELN